MTEKKSPIAGAVIAVIVVIAAGWYFVGGGMEAQTAKTMTGIYNTVSKDSVEKYEIAKRSGSEMDACVNAGMVAAAYLQSKDETSYQKWKDIEKNDCANAGITR